MKTRSSFAVFLLLNILLSACTPSNAQLTSKYKNYDEYRSGGISYGLFKPVDMAAGKKYPLVLYLHGANDTVSRDLQLYQADVQQKHPCFVITPKCREANQGWGNTWTDKHSPATAITLQVIDSLLKIYPIDTDRLYVYGISMGGFGVFAILQKNPGKFTAAYSVCGGSDTKAATALVSTPLWIFHGAEDDIVPVRLSRDVYTEIKNKGGKLVHYTEYPGVKHNSWENVSREPGLIEWLFSQKK